VKATIHAEFCNFGGWGQWGLYLDRNSIYNHLLEGFSASIGMNVYFINFSVGYSAPSSNTAATSAVKSCVFASAINGEGSPSQGPQPGRSLSSFPSPPPWVYHVENCYKTKAQASAKAADVWCAGRSYWANFIIEQ